MNNINTTRILIADDHTVIAQGMKLLMGHHFNIKDILECQNPNEIATYIQSYRISHLILDVTFPEDSGINYIGELFARFPNLRLMLFTMHPPNLFNHIFQDFPQILFCQKSASEEKLLNTLKLFLNSSLTKNNSIMEKLNERVQWKLSKNEEQVLKLLLEGKTTTEISKMLNVKSNTISTYKRRIFDKTDATNIMELARIFK